MSYSGSFLVTLDCFSYFRGSLKGKTLGGYRLAATQLLQHQSLATWLQGSVQAFLRYSLMLDITKIIFLISLLPPGASGAPTSSFISIILSSVSQELTDLLEKYHKMDFSTYSTNYNKSRNIWTGNKCYPHNQQIEICKDNVENRDRRPRSGSCIV